MLEPRLSNRHSTFHACAVPCSAVLERSDITWLHLSDRQSTFHPLPPPQPMGNYQQGKSGELASIVDAAAEREVLVNDLALGGESDYGGRYFSLLVIERCP